MCLFPGGFCHSELPGGFYYDMKIDEPKTPYHYDDVAEEQSTSATNCPNALTDKVKESLSEDDYDSDEELANTLIEKT